jgi:hypothetical protein
VPKLFLPYHFSWYLVLSEGDGIDDSSPEVELLLGYDEAKMMREEGLFRNVGDELSDFFGLPVVKIVGILAPTNSILDESHILNRAGFEGLEVDDSLLVKATPENELKYFYLYDNENLPVKLQSLVDRDLRLYDGYMALYVGYDEAKMMKAEGLFREQFDMIDELFGNDVVIAGVLKKTYTLLDMLHFVPKDEWK